MQEPTAAPTWHPEREKDQMTIELFLEGTQPPGNGDTTTTSTGAPGMPSQSMIDQDYFYEKTP